MSILRVIPANSKAIQDKNSSAIAYTYELDGRLIAKGFSGRKGGSDYHLRYKDSEARTASINRHFEKVQAREQDRKDRAKARASFNHTLVIGSILSASWGYDQTQVNFFQVVELVGKKSVKIRAIRSRIDSQELGSDYVVPVKDSFSEWDTFTKDDNAPTLKRVKEHNVISVSSYANAYPWDGKGKRETAFGFGR